MSQTARKATPDQETLLDLLSYDAETGTLTWRIRSAEFIRRHGLHLSFLEAWNRSYAGTKVNTILPKGYIGVTIFDVHYFAHRIIWKMVFGVDADHIDHINGVTGDNRLINLRDVDALENQHNRKLNSNNSSGHSGVYWCRTTRKYAAKIKSGGTTRMLGRFNNIEDAIGARKAAELDFNFNKNHGRS